MNRAVTGLDGDDERDLVAPGPPRFPSIIKELLAAHDGVVDLDAAFELPAGLARDHHLGQLLAHQPGTVPLDPDLTRQRQRRDRILRLRDQPHGLEPARQWQLGARKNCAGDQRSLAAAAVAEIEPALADDGVIGRPAVGTDKSVRPAPPSQRRLALHLSAVARHELVEAHPDLKLNSIARHAHLPKIHRKSQRIRRLRRFAHSDG